MINSLFEPPFGGVRGNVRTSFIARWKARGRLPIRYNWAFFDSFYGWDVISGHWSKSAFFQGEAGHLKRYVILFHHKARVCRTDGRTDRQTD